MPDDDWYDGYRKLWWNFGEEEEIDEEPEEELNDDEEIEIVEDYEE